MKFFRDDQVGQKSGNTCRCTVKQPSLATFVREYMPDTSQLFWYCRATQFYKFTRVLKGVDEHNTSVAGALTLQSMEDTTSTSVTTDGFSQQVDYEPEGSPCLTCWTKTIVWRISATSVRLAPRKAAVESILSHVPNLARGCKGATPWVLCSLAGPVAP
jgi:hypothetical protein